MTRHYLFVYFLGIILNSIIFMQESLAQHQPFSRWAIEEHEITFDLYLDAEVKVTEEEIEEGIKLAEQCWNEAFEKAKMTKLRLKFRLGKMRDLALENSSLFHHQFPALHSDGSPMLNHVPGYSTKQFNIFLSPAIARSHVKSIWPKNVKQNIRQLAIRAAEEFIECDRIYREELSPLQSLDQGQFDSIARTHFDELIKKHHEACDRAHAIDERVDQLLQSSRITLKSGSGIYIRAQPDSYAKNEFATTLAHEIGHAWGGLADRYNGTPEQREQNAHNLMGRDEKCNLTKFQVEAIFKFRSFGKEEVFD